MDSLEENICRLLNAGYKLKITSDTNTFTVTVSDDVEHVEKSNISLSTLMQSLVTTMITEQKATIINAKHKLKFLDPMNLTNWSDV
jgi:pyoverdine/dityrosine biosynthesis protein Dit1